MGLGNYAALLHDPHSLDATTNTFLFTVMAVGIGVPLGLGLALLLWRGSLFNRVALAFMLIPVSITPLAVGLVFKALLAVEFGPIGYYARLAGLVGERGFFGYSWSAFLTIVGIDAWEWTPLWR